MDLMLGAKPAPAAVKAVDTASFEKDVIAASLQGPVIVDFWAPWCGPCKQLGPILERTVAATNGKATMVKIDIDQNPQIAQALRVQSIPTVYAFYQGRPLDGFQGLLPESQVKEFVAKIIQMSGGGGDPIVAALAQAKEAQTAGDIETATDIYTEILCVDPANAPARAGLARILLESGQAEAAKQLLHESPAEVAKHAEILAAFTALDLAQQSQSISGETAALEQKLAAAPDDHQLRFDLAMAQYGSGDREAAVTGLLEIIARDAAWSDGQARIQLLKLFEAFGFSDPLSVDGRRRLSALLFK